MNLCVPIARSTSSLEDSLAFLDRIGEKVKGKPESEALVRVTQAVECIRRDQQKQMAKVKVGGGQQQQLREIFLDEDRRGKRYRIFFPPVVVQGMLEEIGAKLDEVESVGQVHKEYYKVASEYYKLQGEHSNYYQVHGGEGGRSNQKCLLI